MSGENFDKSIEENRKVTPPKPGLEFLSRFEIELGSSIYELGKTGVLGKRRIIPISGGKFSGPLLSGKILNNGADWQIVTEDGLAIIDTRYLLKTHDKALIYIQTKGFRYGPPEIIEEIAKGKLVDPKKYYFRVNIHFETAVLQYEWLNRVLAIGAAMRLSDSVVLDAYYVK